MIAALRTSSGAKLRVQDAASSAEAGQSELFSPLQAH